MARTNSKTTKHSTSLIQVMLSVLCAFSIMFCYSGITPYAFGVDENTPTEESSKTDNGDSSQGSSTKDDKESTGGNESEKDSGSSEGKDSGSSEEKGSDEKGSDEEESEYDGQISVYGLYAVDSYGSWQGDRISPDKNPTITQQGGKLRICLQETFYNSDWSEYYDYLQYEDDWIDISPRYESSDAETISVDNNGILTAHKNSEDGVVITVYGDFKGKTYSASVTVYAKNQDAADVKKVQILSTTGKVLNTALTPDFSDTNYYQLYARVTFVDGTTRSTLPSATDYDKNFDEHMLDDGRLVWSINNTDVGYVNSESGRFKALDDGLVKVTATIAGVNKSITIQINTGKFTNSDSYNPCDSITVKIVYEANEDLVYVQKVYSVAQISALGLETFSYTLTGTNGKYYYSVATGIRLAKILEDNGVVLDEVRGFRFSGNDNYSPSLIGASVLFDTARYCFPNYDLGGSTAEKVAVPAMLAVKCSWSYNSIDEDPDGMTDGPRFRLLFGSTGRSDGLWNKSVYNIYNMTIVMKGAAPSGKDDDDDGSGDKGDKGDDDGGGSKGDGGSGKGDGGSGKSDNGSGDDSNDGDGTGAGDEPGTPSPNGSGDDSTNSNSSSKGKGNSSSGKDVIEVDPDDIDVIDNTGHKYHVYEMMNAQKSNIAALDIDNPFEPYTLPFAILLFVAGAGATTWQYKRQRKVVPTLDGDGDDNDGDDDNSNKSEDNLDGDLQTSEKPEQQSPVV